MKELRDLKNLTIHDVQPITMTCSEHARERETTGYEPLETTGYKPS